MRNKKGFELPLNMIIIVIVALAFLGIALKITYDWFNSMPKIEFPTKCKINPPTAENPVCVSEEYIVKRGSVATLSLMFYNNEDGDIASTSIPSVTCAANVDGKTLSFKQTSIGKNLAVGTAQEYQVILGMDKAAIRGTYPCTLGLSQMQGAFRIVLE